MKLKDLLLSDYHKINSNNLLQYKRKWAKLLGKTPKNSQILYEYKKQVIEKTIEKKVSFEKLLRIKKTRTISGVSPLAVMTKPFYCPGQCIYCPLEYGMPKSYLSDEPAAQRAKTHKFDAYQQVKDRLKQLKETGHITDKVEVIVIGGTFSVYPEAYKKFFFKRIFDACNNKDSKTLFEAQKLNETAKQRIVSISVETRPDFVDEREVIIWRKLGVTKVQLGVQAFNESILKKIKRGHSLAKVAYATLLCRNAGLKICYHLMPNLPGSSPKQDIAMAKIMYEDKRFKPDFLKLYPTQVIAGTKLYEMWKRGKYQTYDDETLKYVLKQIKLLTPSWVRIDRLVRDISSSWVESGTKKSNMRQVIQEELKKSGKECQCIRCREVKHLSYKKKPDLIIQPIETFGAKEYFLSFANKEKLYALLRLRLPYRNQKLLFSELKQAAIVREIHTFGSVVPIEKKQISKTQHQGLGKTLLQKAQEIAEENGYKKIAVISAIGTRNYYRKLGYKLDGLYMTKTI